MQSGSGLCHWAMEEKPFEYAQTIAESVGCPATNGKILVDCLRTVSVDKILLAQSKGKVRCLFII